MADIKWIKLSVNMFDDEKIKLIRSMPEGNAILVVWIQLLSLAGKTNDSGMIYIARHMAYSEEMLATIFTHPLNVIRLALNTLASFDLIEVNPEGVINITNWEKHQNIEGMEQLKERDAERQRIYYYRKKIKEVCPDVEYKNLPGTSKELKKHYENLTLGLTLPHDLEREEEKSKSKKENKELLLDEKKTSGSSGGQNIHLFYQQNFGMASSHIVEDLNYWVDDLSEELVIEALKKTIEAEKPYSYAKGIMRNWASKGIKTLEDVESMDVSKRRKLNEKSSIKGESYGGIEY